MNRGYCQCGRKIVVNTRWGTRVPDDSAHVLCARCYKSELDSARRGRVTTIPSLGATRRGCTAENRSEQ
jgi:hypothetical protein